MSAVEDNEREFIKELEQLSRKYGIAIAGCGCCGSPYLVDLNNNPNVKAGYSNTDDGLKWVDPEDHYDWNKYSNEIIK